MSPHDPRHLVQRWKALARTAGVRLQPLVQAGELPLFFIKTKALGATGGLYLSAGVHGDEPAATEALLAWAESHAAQLREMPLLIFPCLNPWGLARNLRVDAAGRDLNRSFHLTQHPVIAAVRSVTHGHRFAATVHLHEDYDAEGIYLYELARSKILHGRSILDAGSLAIAPDPRRSIEGSRSQLGHIHRRVAPQRFADLGYPEAIWLFAEHADRSYTIETPSESALPTRITAHCAMLHAIERCVAPGVGF